MIYTVINGDVCINKIKIGAIATASNFFVGDLKRVALSSWLDSPPEEVIVGVTIGVVTPRETSADEGTVSGE